MTETVVRLAAGQWWDGAGRPGRDDLDVVPEPPPLPAQAPDRVFLVCRTPDGRQLSVQVPRAMFPPDVIGPQRTEHEPGTAWTRGDTVWVWSTMCRAWCPGTVEQASRHGVQVSYEPTSGRGTASDTVAPCYVAHRHDVAVAAQTSPTTSAVRR